MKSVSDTPCSSNIVGSGPKCSSVLLLSGIRNDAPKKHISQVPSTYIDNDNDFGQFNEANKRDMHAGHNTGHNGCHNAGHNGCHTDDDGYTPAVTMAASQPVNAAVPAAVVKYSFGNGNVNKPVNSALMAISDVTGYSRAHYNEMGEQNMIPPKFIDMRNWPRNTNLLCWQCCLEIHGVPRFIPGSPCSDGSIEVIGLSCTFACAARYILDFEKNEGKRKRANEILSIAIYKMTGKLQHLVTTIKPRTCMLAYGGTMSNDNYRQAALSADAHMILTLPYPSVDKPSNLRSIWDVAGDIETDSDTLDHNEDYDPVDSVKTRDDERGAAEKNDEHIAGDAHGDVHGDAHSGIEEYSSDDDLF